MRTFFVVLTAAISTMTAPAFAQATAPATAAPQAKPQMVKKKVCTRVVEIGSMVGSQRVCRVVEVEAKAPKTSANTQQQQAPGAAGANN